MRWIDRARQSTPIACPYSLRVDSGEPGLLVLRCHLLRTKVDDVMPCSLSGDDDTHLREKGCANESVCDLSGTWDAPEDRQNVRCTVDEERYRTHGVDGVGPDMSRQRDRRLFLSTRFDVAVPERSEFIVVDRGQVVDGEECDSQCCTRRNGCISSANDWRAGQRVERTVLLSESDARSKHGRWKGRASGTWL